MWVRKAIIDSDQCVFSQMTYKFSEKNRMYQNQLKKKQKTQVVLLEKKWHPWTDKCHKENTRPKQIDTQFLPSILGTNNFSFLKTLPENGGGEGGGTVPKSLYETRVILIPKPEIDRTRRKKLQAMSLMNVHAEILNETLAN